MAAPLKFYLDIEVDLYLGITPKTQKQKPAINKSYVPDGFKIHRQILLLCSYI